VIGEHLAELALGLEPTFDLEPFSLTRFAERRARYEHNLI
jgi:glycine/D-amino acid oxidase-like deaminating enzyme